MQCANCGQENPAQAPQCSRCGAPLHTAAPLPAPTMLAPPGAGPLAYPGGGFPQVPNYLVQAILVTLFCCMPFGIAAIVFAAQVNSKLQIGDYAGAMQASKSAKTWSWVAFGCGIATYLLVFLFYGVVIIAALSSGINTGTRQ